MSTKIFSLLPLTQTSSLSSSISENLLQQVTTIISALQCLLGQHTVCGTYSKTCESTGMSVGV